MIGASRSVFCQSKVHWSVSLLVYCLSVLLMFSISQFSGVCSKLVNQLELDVLVIRTVINAIGRVPVGSFVCL